MSPVNGMKLNDKLSVGLKVVVKVLRTSDERRALATALVVWNPGLLPVTLLLTNPDACPLVAFL